MTTAHELHTERARYLTRRWFLRDCGVGLAGIALHSLLSREAIARSGNLLQARQPHFPAKVKRVVYLFHAGAPSHLELYDHKPQLTKHDGKLPPPSCSRGIAQHSSIRTPHYWVRSTPLRATARAASS